MTKSEGHPLPPVHQRNTVVSQTRLQPDANSRSYSKSNRPTTIKHTISKTDGKFCGGANNNKKGNSQLEGHAPSKHPKHLNNPKLKQELATNMDLNNRGGLRKKSPTTTTTKTPTSSPKQHQPPP